MKKAISVSVALLMVLSIVSIALAEETNAEGDVADSDPAAESADDTAVVTDTADAPEEELTVLEAVETGVVTQTEVDDAGVTPDSPVLWGLDRAIERISLALTFGKSAKAHKGLAHARERLMEVKTMIAEKKLEKAAKAEAGHGKALGKVKEAVEEMDGDDPEQQLAEQTEIGQELDEQQKEMDQIKVKAKAKLQLTPEQQAKLDELVASLKDNIGEAKVKVEVKKNKIEIKIQAKPRANAGTKEENDVEDE